MNLFEQTQFAQFLEDHAKEGRDIQLYDLHGQTLFPVFHPDGGLMSISAVYPILRGEGESAPPFDGRFPTNDGETKGLGCGWIVMCVHFSYEQTVMGMMTKLERAEEKLRAMKQGGQNAA